MRVLSRLAPIVGRFTSDEEVFIDIGSSRTRIITHSKVVCNQPTCLAVHTQSQSVVAVGERAYQLLGKVVPGLEIVFPVHDGRIADEESFVQFLSVITKRYIRPNYLDTLIGVHGKLGVSYSQSPAQRSLIESSISAAGWYRVTCHDSAVAITRAVVPNAMKAGHVAICDIGGTQTELSVVSVGSVSYSQTISWGGLAISNLLQDHIHREHQAAVGWHTVEKLKKDLQLLSVGSKKRATKHSIRGKDVVSQTAKTVVLDSSSFKPALTEYLDELVFEIKGFITALPSELSSDILKSGIYLSGGGAQLHGLSEYVSEALNTSVQRGEEPSWDVVRGLSLQDSQDGIE
jgi:rod shape-determining protein MreB and related proteins